MVSFAVGIPIAFQRETRGLTQEKLARKAWLHRVTIANIERGAESPTSDTLQRIVSAVRLPMADLLK